MFARPRKKRRPGCPKWRLIWRPLVPCDGGFARSGGDDCGGRNCRDAPGRPCRPAEAADVGANLKGYFSILATGEALFVTFYSNAVANHRALGLAGAELNALKAILIEEQIHYDFAVANGGTPATTHFSFPHGAKTFENRALFLQTQQLSEELTNGALLAWIKDMASMGQPRLAQIGGQLMQVEGGHRVVGRVILNAEPWDNWAFGPVGPRQLLAGAGCGQGARLPEPAAGQRLRVPSGEHELPGRDPQAAVRRR